MIVAITGVGAVTGLGDTAQATFDALLAGKTALTDLDYPDSRGPVAHAAGPIRTSTELALAAVAEATAEFGGSAVLGLIGASTSGDMLLGEPSFSHHVRAEALPHPERFLWAQLCHSPTQQIRSYLTHRGLNPTGPCHTLSTACTSGTCAVGTAAGWLRLGHCDAVIVAGFDGLCRTTIAGFGSLGVYAPQSTRPFDRRRDGMNIGEGAGALLLEPLDRALARGATPLALVTGYGNTSDAHHLTAPDPEATGAIAAIRQALGDRPASTVGYVNAHATGTQLNDAMEARAIGSTVPNAAVSGIKGGIGHTLGAAGAIEAVISALTIHQGVLPPNVGGTQPEFDLDIIQGPTKREVESVLSVNFAFGGHNAALLLSRVAP